MQTYLLDAHIIFKCKILCFCKDIYSFVFLSPFNLEAHLTWFSRITFTGIKLLYNVVPVSVVQWSQSAICMHISPPSWSSLLPPHPSHLGHQRALNWASCVVWQVPTIFFFLIPLFSMFIHFWTLLCRCWISCTGLIIFILFLYCFSLILLLLFYEIIFQNYFSIFLLQFFHSSIAIFISLSSYLFF